jgi:hypothetical protein
MGARCSSIDHVITRPIMKQAISDAIKANNLFWKLVELRGGEQ